MQLDNCRVVLVRPRNPNNIGAVARAIKNFGYSDLFVVSPHPPVWNEVVSAKNAEDIIKNTSVVDTLAEAINDRTMVIGTADRTRLAPDQVVFTPRDLRRDLSKVNHRIALVFGQENHGLTNEDLSHCHRIMTIPTDPLCASINLGQAVAICCYELGGYDSADISNQLQAEAATAGEIEIALELAMEVLRLSDYIIPGQEADLKIKSRTSLMRLNLTGPEVGRLCGILRKVKDGLL